MKKLYVLLLSVALVLVAASMALGAIHDSFMDFSNPLTHASYYYRTGGDWFYVEKDDPFVQAVANDIRGGSSFAAEYWQNDQTFIEGNYAPSSSLPAAYFGSYYTSVQASYLADNNFFFGFETDPTQTMLSPGYLFNLNDNGYIAGSVDYSITTTDKRDIAGYEVDGKYYGDNYKAFGQYYYEKASKKADYFGALNYKIADAIVLGGIAGRNVTTGNYYVAGASLTPDFGVFDAAYERDNSVVSITSISALFKVDDAFALGFDYKNESDIQDVMYAFKAKYQVLDGGLLFTYQLPTKNSWNSVVSLRFNKTLK